MELVQQQSEQHFQQQVVAQLINARDTFPPFREACLTEGRLTIHHEGVIYCVVLTVIQEKNSGNAPEYLDSNACTHKKLLGLNGNIICIVYSCKLLIINSFLRKNDEVVL